MSPRVHFAVKALTACLLLGDCSADPEVIEDARRQLVKDPARVAASVNDRASVDLSPRLMRRYRPLAPVADEPNTALVDLGRTLYFDPRLSATHDVSCNTCHPLASWGATSAPLAIGVKGRVGKRNAPTTYNAARHFRQFWDGRAATLEEQAGGPLENADEMGQLTSENVMRAVKAIRGYEPLFAAAYPGSKDAVTWDNLRHALAAFERGLITPSRWDRYLAGDLTALTGLEKEGARQFANVGCMVCHSGELVGGSLYEKLGAAEPWPNQADRGRFGITHDPGDDMMFKVPSLRNVAKTAPYFHDGSAATLSGAVRLMARHQIGEELTDAETEAIVAWLGALTGDLPEAYIAPPRLPPLTLVSEGHE